MKTYDQILYETEEKSNFEDEFISKKIILKLNEDNDIKLPTLDYYVPYSAMLQMILINPEYLFCRNQVVQMLEENNYNWKNVVFRFISIINDGRLPDSIRVETIKSFKSFPFCKNIEILENGCIIETTEGTIEAYKLNRLLKNEMLCKALDERTFLNRCHSAVEECKLLFPATNIITSELPTLFGGIMYHSYFKDETKGQVFDIALNTLYTGDTFNAFYNPNELLNVPSDKLDEYSNELPKDNKYYKVLRMALNNKIKFEEES